MPKKMNSSANGVKCQPASFRAVPEFLCQTAALFRHLPELLRQLPERFRHKPDFRRELSEQLRHATESFRHAKNLQKSLNGGFWS